MSPDLEIAIVTGGAVIMIFLIALWAQRLAPMPGGLVVGDHPKDWASVFDGRLATMEERQKLTDERSKSTEHDVRNIRAALQALPSKDAVHRLEVEQARLAGKVETVETVVVGTQRAVDRIENHLLSGAKTS